MALIDMLHCRVCVNERVGTIFDFTRRRVWLGSLAANADICVEIIAGEGTEQGDLTKTFHCCVVVDERVVIAEGVQ